MQRTKKGTEFAFVKASLVNGEVKTTQGVARYPIKDPNKARKALNAEYGDVSVLNSKEYAELTFMNDCVWELLCSKSTEEAKQLEDKVREKWADISKIIND